MGFNGVYGDFMGFYGDLMGINRIYIMGFTGRYPAWETFTKNYGKIHHF